MRILAELRQRRVFQAAAIYVAAAWGIVEILSFLLVRLGAPNATLNWIAALFVCGFPVAMLSAWFFDITPEGIKRVRSVSSGGNLTVLTAVGLLAAATAALSYLLLKAPPEETDIRQGIDFQPPPNSVAVLPFTNLSQSPDNEYFSDGLSDTLIDRLANDRGLIVIARTSSFAFKNQNMDVRSIGQQLNVAALVEGSVQRAGDRLRIIAQLVRTTDGAHLWSETFDRGLDDIFDIQDDIAARIGSELAAHLSQRAGNLTRSRNMRAYDLYLLGRHHLHRRTEPDLRHAIDLLGQAIELEPDFAPAYSGLADAYLLLLDYSNAPREQVIPKAREAVDTALALDDGSAEAQASNGLLLRATGDSAASEQALRRAIELNGNYAMAYMWLAITLEDQGRYLEAAPLHAQALKLNPLSFQVNNRAGLNSFLRGDFELSRKRYQAAISIEPSHPNGYWGLGLTAWGAGELEDAVHWYEEAIERAPDRVPFLSQLAAVYFDRGDTESAADWADKAYEIAADFGYPFLTVSAAYGKGVTLAAQNRMEGLYEFVENLATIEDTDPNLLVTVGGLLTLGGEYAAAVEYFDRVETLAGDETLLLRPWDISYGICFASLKGAALAAIGEQARAREIGAMLSDTVSRLQSMGLGLPQADYCAAAAAAVQGETERSMTLLERSIAAGSRRCNYARLDPSFAALHYTAGFQTLVSRCGG